MKQKTNSFRIQLAAAISCAVTIPALLTGWLIIYQVESSLLQEKEQKLLTIAQQLDMMMPGTYDDYLRDAGSQLSRREKINRLHAALATVTEEVAKRNPGVGVGYYAKNVNAVVTYGPDKEMHEKVGVSIDASHPGQRVLTTGKPLVSTGLQVRGDIMNAMVPVIRSGTIIGYVWANEKTDSIVTQLRQLERKLFVLLGVGILFSIAAAFFIAHRVGGALDGMISAIGRTNTDFRTRMPEIRGILGAIPSAFNALMDRLAQSQEQNRILEESVRRADRLQALGRLATGMAHEIRNPLASIKAFAQIIEETPADEAANKEYLSIIIGETERLNGLVEQMLLFGKPSPGLKEWFNVSDLIRRSLILIEHECRKKQIVMEYDLQPVFMNADPHLMQQVIVNVLLNAMQAAPSGGRIQVASSNANDRVHFSVFNTGSSISAKYREAVFHPFFTTKEQGTGLGLSVTQNIVHVYHGTIEFRNHKDGVEFMIELPQNPLIREAQGGTEQWQTF